MTDLRPHLYDHIWIDHSPTAVSALARILRDKGDQIPLGYPDTHVILQCNTRVNHPTKNLFSGCFLHKQESMQAQRERSVFSIRLTKDRNVSVDLFCSKASAEPFLHRGADIQQLVDPTKRQNMWSIFFVIEKANAKTRAMTFWSILPSQGCLDLRMST